MFWNASCMDKGGLQYQETCLFVCAGFWDFPSMSLTPIMSSSLNYCPLDCLSFFPILHTPHVCNNVLHTLKQWTHKLCILPRWPQDSTASLYTLVRMLDWGGGRGSQPLLLTTATTGVCQRMLSNLEAGVDPKFFILKLYNWVSHLTSPRFTSLPQKTILKWEGVGSLSNFGLSLSPFLFIFSYNLIFDATISLLPFFLFSARQRNK